MARTAPRLLALATAALTVVLAACNGAEATSPTKPPADPSPTSESPVSTISESEAMVWLEAPTGEFQVGWARIWEEAGNLFVEIDVAPSEAVAQPAHLHSGDCAMLGPIVQRLENVIAGHSLTELPNMTLADVANGDLSVNLHQSFANFSTFTACGEIPLLIQN